MSVSVRLRLLRLFLAGSAFAWGVSVFGVFLPWPTAVETLQGLGAKTIPADPMLDYWLRMASGAFFLVGVLFLLLALYPKRFANIIPVMGAIMLAEGAILLFHGVRLGLSPFPFYGDTAFCFVSGGGILLLRDSARSSE